MAATVDFVASLDGEQEVNADGTSAGVVTDAFGTARISVDTVAETIDFNLSVTGLSLDDLLDSLVAAPVGPVHLHNAAAGANGPIVVPFAFDLTTYSDTAAGFDIDVVDFSFDDATALAGSSQGFSTFLDELNAGNFYVNVHTDAFAAGELRGQVAPVPLPASVLLGFGALGALGGLRMRARKAA